MAVGGVGEGRKYERGAAPLSGVLIGVFALGHALAFMDRHVLAVTAPLIQTSLSLDDAQMGLLLGPAFVILYALGLVAGRRLWVSPRLRIWLAVCVFVWTLGMLVMALAAGFETLVAGRALVGLGQAAFIPLALGLIVEGVRQDVRARAVAAFTTGSAVGRSLGLVLGGAVLAMLAAWLPAGGALADWRWLLLICCVPNAVLAAALLRLGRGLTTGASVPPGFGPVVGWMAVRPWLMLTYLLATAAGVLVIQTVGAWAPTWLNRDFGLGVAEAGMAFGAVLLVAAPMGHFAAGTLLDRFGDRVGPTGIGAGALAACVGALAGLQQASDAATVLVLLGVISALAALAAVAALAGLGAMLPGGLKADGVRLCLVFTTLIGVGLGPWLAGLVSASGVGLGAALFQVCAAAAAVGAVGFAAASRAWRRASEEQEA